MLINISDVYIYEKYTLYIERYERLFRKKTFSKFEINSSLTYLLFFFFYELSKRMILFKTERKIQLILPRVSVYKFVLANSVNFIPEYRIG